MCHNCDDVERRCQYVCCMCVCAALGDRVSVLHRHDVKCRTEDFIGSFSRYRQQSCVDKGVLYVVVHTAAQQSVDYSVATVRYHKITYEKTHQPNSV